MTIMISETFKHSIKAQDAVLGTQNIMAPRSQLPLPF
jgi:hypothetical protein